MMKTIQYNGRAVPVAAEAEICVVGGGPGGLGAAVTAARQGRAVLLVERYGAPGGMAFFGEVNPFMSSHAGGKALDHPVYGEWREKILGYLPDNLRPEPFDPEGNSEAQCRISKDAAMFAAEDLLLEAGVRLLYHHNLIDVVTDGGRIAAAVFSTKGGLRAVAAAVFIDSTGDGDLAALAGCPVEFGGESGYCQPMTTCFKLGNVDRRRMPSRAEINRRFDEAKKAGVVKRNPRENILCFDTPEPGIVHFNTTRIIHRSGVDGGDLSAAEIEGRAQVRETIDFLRGCVPGFEQATLHSVAHHVGVRESRRIRGRNYLTVEAFDTCAKFPDGVCRVSYTVDIHNPDGTGTLIRHIPPGEWYEIPFGCLVPQNCDNLLMGCRAISVDHALHSSMRVMPPVISVGQAAGMGAAMALEAGLPPAGLDGRAVRARRGIGMPRLAGNQPPAVVSPAVHPGHRQ